MIANYPMTIGGLPVMGEERFDVWNPATDEVVARAPACNRLELDAAMVAAESAFRSWRADVSLRQSCLLQAADAVEAAADELAHTLTAEQGKPIVEAQLEAVGGAYWLRYFATLEDPPEVLHDDDKALVTLFRKPVGPVAGIIPWNYPLIMALQTIAPALAAGNTVVLKPSPFTPLTTLALGRVLADIFPPGVLNVVSGPDPLGAWMTEHPAVRKIHFTGSVATGKEVAAAAAPDLKRVTLELGGNDPAILLEDVDVDKIADRVFWAAFRNNGQVCVAIKRLYVPERKQDDVVNALAERAKDVCVGEGTRPDTQLGPINNRPQFERVSELVGDALNKGAIAAAGGRPIDGPGNFFEPTVLTALSDGVRIVDEEQFGPALPVMSYRNVEDAIDRANGTHFGLGASVWTSDPDRGEEVARKLESGAAWVNTHMEVRPSIPMGGVKWSGIGVAFGPEGYRSFTENQVVYRAKE